ncbi:MAG: hypothetical protein LC776_11375 [Acidobacteria bacterium]|nr:hypothetical protein [Acidobacteriota bacterium]
MATEIRVCFKNRLKNAYLTVATVDIDDAKRIARIWGETTESEPVTRTIFKQQVSTPTGPSDPSKASRVGRRCSNSIV